MNIALPMCRWVFLSFALWSLTGCNATELVSEHAFKEKVERPLVGQPSVQVVDRNRLTWYFADTEVGVGINRYTPPSGVPPVNAGAFPTNARG